MILACDVTGQPHQWLTRESAVTLKCKGLISYEWGDSGTVLHGGISRMTGKQSTIDVQSIIVLKGKHKVENRIPSLTNRNLFRRDLHICGYCGRKFGDDQLTRDHIIPRSRGGKDIWTNVVTACRHCNNDKDNKMLDECGMELLYVPYVPNRAEALILANRRILADQMTHLRSYVPSGSRVHLIN